MIRWKYIETEYEGEMAWNLTHSSSLGPIIILNMLLKVSNP